MSKRANELASGLPQMGTSSEVTPKEKQAPYTGGTVRMLDTQIEAEDSNVPLCCAEMFVDKVECVPDERSECMICGRIWKLDGLRWRMSNL